MHCATLKLEHWQVFGASELQLWHVVDKVRKKSNFASIEAQILCFKLVCCMLKFVWTG